jgi:hypothetical protein
MKSEEEKRAEQEAIDADENEPLKEYADGVFYVQCEKDTESRCDGRYIKIVPN